MIEAMPKRARLSSSAWRPLSDSKVLLYKLFACILQYSYQCLTLVYWLKHLDMVKSLCLKEIYNIALALEFNTIGPQEIFLLHFDMPLHIYPSRA